MSGIQQSQVTSGVEGTEFERGTGEVWTDAGYKIVDAHLKSFSPTNLTDSPFTSYVCKLVQCFVLL
jgi:hypothetical protein